MTRADRICRHPLWRDCIAQIAALEQDRKFCRHDLEHLLAVARLAYIENLERGLGEDKELIYAAALLHDAGRHLEYTRGIPHDRAGAELAGTILADCGFAPEEIRRVQDAIQHHRRVSGGGDGENPLAGLLYRADKASRACLFCPAEPECNWTPEQKNLTLRE